MISPDPPHLDMKEIEFLGLTVFQCPSTGGLWFDQGGLGRLKTKGDDALLELDELAKGPQPPSTAKGRRCPRCLEPLQPYKYMNSSPVELDACPKCGGIYVDDGELAAIVEFLQSRSLKPATPEAAMALGHAHLSMVDAREKRSRLDSLIEYIWRLGGPHGGRFG